LRLLPCVGAPILYNYLTALGAEVEIDLLPVAVPSALPFRVRDDQPDAIVIVTEEFPPTAWRNSSSLRKALADTPTLLLVGEVNAALKQRAARFHIRSTLPLDVTTDQLLAAIWATVAGLAVTLELSSQAEDKHTGWTSSRKNPLPALVACPSMPGVVPFGVQSCPETRCGEQGH
jgi:hypothetical protein